MYFLPTSTERRLIQLPFLAYPSGPIDAGKLH